VISTQRRPRSGAFTLIDILVSLTVIALLIGIMLPSISMVRESARKVICSSDMRQIGLGMNLYAEDNKSMLPSSVFLDFPESRNATAIYPQLMDTIRTDPTKYAAREWDQWDGLGLLFYKSYISAPGVYYCPSHTGNNAQETYEDQWNFSTGGEIIANYQFRGVGPFGQRHLYEMKSTDAMVTDSLRSLEDINHENGLNVLAAGLSVSWYEDINNEILESVASRTDESIARDTNAAWTLFDGGPRTVD
jgi:type II secretory pathway pseudopilin PulG